MSNLFPSQQETADAVSASFAEKPDSVVMLRGPSGLGKSTVVSAVAEREERSLTEVSAWRDLSEYSNAIGVAEENRWSGSLVESITRVRDSAWRVMATTPPGSTLTEDLGNANIPVTEITLRPLEESEIDDWIDARRPKTTDEERGLLHRYSLGVPLLLERILETAPVTHETAKTALSAYIRGLSQAHHIFADTPVAFQQVMSEFLGTHLRKPPDDLSWEKLQADLWKDVDPLSAIHEASVDHALPLCPDTVERYREWLTQNDGTFVSIYLPKTEGRTQEIMEELGLDDRDIVDPFGGRLKNYKGTGRKVSFFRTAASPYQTKPVIRGFEGISLNAQMLNRFLRSQGTGSCNPYEFDSCGKSGEISLAEGADPFLLVSYDHEGMHRNPLRIGLGTETYLQHKAIPYQVRYGNGGIWHYDPATRSVTNVMSAEEFDAFNVIEYDEDSGEEPPDFLDEE
ncbi:hypothetical protein A2881_04200 [Candidatus Peribacteria bacterium RIFCSPHIGHO2_01_FULL_55_13]|nr:MAG: hypothetical protein A2881_04200 [Candidatus Peribacteria bacterium RIFCSPHIGHO2_01_FULL_55_13]